MALRVLINSFLGHLSGCYPFVMQHNIITFLALIHDSPH